VQDLSIQPNNTCYRLEQWQRADGSYVIAKAPGDGHFGPTLVSYILYQYHHQHVTQPLLLEHLLELGVEISAGQLSQILTLRLDDFHQEKDAVLSVGIEVSRYLQAEDTGARHKGKNGYCTYIGNDLFAWFKSTQSKSRVNFLELLRAEQRDYVINAGALEYMQHRGLPKAQLTVLESHGGRFADHAAWEQHLAEVGIKSPRHVTLATEGALMGSLLAHGFPIELAIVSDDAGQFNVFAHALCWIHAERGLSRLIPFNDNHRKAQSWVQTQIWNLYGDLKTYQAAPTETLKRAISQGFDHLCATQTDFETLNQALKRLHHNKAELLLVLEKPWLPLHNNLSERDIREYVKKRKISGSTRSDLGRRCRDTFASLKKTCRKHAISFWEYLKDRVSGKNAILPLPEIIRQAAQAR
jgi:Transposase IS66 family